MSWVYTVSGFGVGLVVGLTGVGGGSLMTPLLIFLFGFAPSSAVGTDLLFAAVTKSGGSYLAALRDNVDWRVVRRLMLGSVPAAVASLYVLQRLAGETRLLESLISTLLGASLLLTAIALLFKERLLKAQQRQQPEPADGAEATWVAPATVVTGLVLGVLVTLSSVGAGALGTVTLFFLYPRMRTARLVGSDIAHAVPLTAIAGLGHWHLGTVNLVLLGSLLLGSLPGIYVGSRLSAQLPEKLVRALLALMLLITGLRFVW
jgi:uncharacterized protein